MKCGSIDRSRHRTIYYNHSWSSYAGFILVGFTLDIILYIVILYICKTTGIPCRCATPCTFL